MFFVEEPIYDAVAEPGMACYEDGSVTVAVPHLCPGTGEAQSLELQRRLLDELMSGRNVTDYILWYYTPLAMPFTAHLQPAAVVYDCMDELSAFKNAPPTLKAREAELLSRADLVFTGGHSLYEAKKHAHANVHAFPSSVDVQHFGQARQRHPDPADQEAVPRPRLGFFGVIDERMDLDLVAGVAAARPHWHLVMVGPVVKIDPTTLPTAPNIHYLGPKTYAELPRYIAGWDVALLPFARNEATRFISPTKTPEYMAAGRPVVSTSIQDVVRPYGQQGLVRIADTVDEFIAACEAALEEDAVARTRAADAFLRQTSWDGTWMQMRGLVQMLLARDAADPARTVANAR